MYTPLPRRSFLRVPNGSALSIIIIMQYLLGLRNVVRGPHTSATVKVKNQPIISRKSLHFLPHSYYSNLAYITRYLNDRRAVRDSIACQANDIMLHFVNSDSLMFPKAEKCH